MMGKLGIAEDEAIQNKLISRSLETAQEKIEGFHFDARKHVLSYDDVMTRQRSFVYGKRREVLMGGFESAKMYLMEIVADNQALMNLVEQKVTMLGEQEFYVAVKRLILQVTDMVWMEHLEAMEYLKSSVNLRAYGQRDPLIEYKKEGIRLFREMKEVVQAEIIRILPGVGAGAFAKEEEKAREVVRNAVEAGGAKDADESAAKPKLAQSDKVGRNELCACGSGKKYKKCHGR
jgi:preprotein translocase subunit SecA